MVKLSNLLSLVQNENMKIYRRPRTWVMLALLLVITLAAAILLRTLGDDKEALPHMLQFMSISVNFTAIAFIFSVVVTAEIVAGEFTWGTIKLLLIRPATRSKILLSKYIASIGFLLLLLVFQYVISAVIGLLFFGTAGEADNLSLLSILKSYGYQSINLFMVSTFAFMMSSAFRSSVLAIALSFILMFVSGSVMAVLIGLKYGWAKYILFANTNLEQYTAGHQPLMEGMTLGFSITMLIVYYILFIGVAWTIFRKRDVAG